MLSGWTRFRVTSSSTIWPFQVFKQTGNGIAPKYNQNWSLKHKLFLISILFVHVFITTLAVMTVMVLILPLLIVKLIPVGNATTFWGEDTWENGIEVTMAAGLATNGTVPSPILLTVGASKRGPLVALFSLTSEFVPNVAVLVAGQAFTSTLSVVDEFIICWRGSWNINENFHNNRLQLQMCTKLQCKQNSLKKSCFLR